MAGIELDGVNQKVVLDSDGDTYLEAATDDTIKVYVAGAHDATISANAINVLSGTTLTIDSGATITNSGTANGFSSANPPSADGDSLGTASLEWSDLFLADGGIIKFGNDQDVLLTHVADTGLLLSGTNVIQFNDASQNIGAPSATVLDINATDEIELNATLLDVNANLDVSGTTLLPTLGVITAKDLGVGIHIRTADSGASVASDMDELVLENSTNTGLTILSATDGLGRIAFGDSGDNAVGTIDYNHDGNLMKFGTSGALGLQIDGNGHVTMPKQSFFVATPTSNSADIAADTTHTIIANSEILDRNGDYNTSNGTFTAPVTGAYALTMNVGIGDYDHDNNYSAGFINTSNRRWTVHFLVGNALSVDGTLFVTGTCIVDMDANDTVTFQFRNDQGAQQPFIAQEFTFLSGYLLG